MTKSTTGVFNIDKPASITSHDVVDYVRKLFSEKAKPRGHHRRLYAVGHAGTLDPFATGVLLVATGSATRLLEYTRDLPKTYLATITLGATSSTDDRTGNITPRAGNTPGVELDSSPGVKEVRATLQTFIGPIQQIPPAYSAVKVKGKKLYEYARQGIGDSTLRQPRPVVIHSIKLLAYQYPTVDLEITCGGGTYIRALARDIGEALGIGAYVEELRRTAIGSFDVKSSVTLDKLSTPRFTLSLSKGSLGVNNLPILPPEVLVSHLPRLTLNSTNVAKLRKGQAIEISEKFSADQPIAISDESNFLIGIGKYDPTSSLLHPQKVLA